MKKITITLMVFFAFLTGQAQITDQQWFQDFLTVSQRNADMTNIEGSPFLTENFMPGKAMINGKELNILMRYDLSSEQMQLKMDTQNEQIYTLPVNTSTTYVVGDDKFIYDDLTFEGKRITGHFIELYEGSSYKLLEKPTLEIEQAVKARSGYEKDKPARYKIQSNFYILTNEDKVEQVELRHKDVKKKFNDAESKKYLSDNKIRSEQDLIKFVAFLDQQ